jgi:ankyrin repeat protein
MINLLLKFKADPNIGSPPPLIAAVMSQAPKVVKIILDQNVDVNAVDADGRTALSQAFIQRSPNISALLDVLLPANPDPNIVPTNEVYEPAIHAAAKGFLYPIIERLLSLPTIDINIRSARGRTVAHVLADRLSYDLGDAHERLIEHPKLDLNAQDADGNTLAHLKSQIPYVSDFTRKVLRKSDLKIRNKAGEAVVDKGEKWFTANHVPFPSR